MDNMTDGERRDFLIEFLTTLYRIQTIDGTNPQIEKEISVYETRLSALGFMDFNKLK